MAQTTQYRFQLWGWILFIASAVFFMTASINAGDPISLIGGALFLLACFVFLVPLLAQLAALDDETDDQADDQQGQRPGMTSRIAMVQPDTERRAEQRWNRHRPADQSHHAQAKPDGSCDMALRAEFARRLCTDLLAERRLRF